MTTNGRGPHPLRDNAVRARGFTLADYLAERAAGGLSSGPHVPSSHSTPPPPPPQQQRGSASAAGSRASSALPPLSANGSRAPEPAFYASASASGGRNGGPAAAQVADQQAYGGGAYYGQSTYGAPQTGYGNGYPPYGGGGQPYNAAPGPSSYPAAAGGGSKKRKKRDRWAGQAVPAANATTGHGGGGGSYSSDDDDDEVDMMTVAPPPASSSSARASSAALREFTPALLDPTGGRKPPAAKKRLRLKGNVDFGKRPSKGRLDQRRPSTSDESDDDDDGRPYRPYEPSDSDDNDGHPLGPRIPMPAAPPPPPPPVAAPPPIPPPPPPQPIEVAPVAPARPGARELGLAKLERLRQEKKAAREREALELAQREAEAAAGPPPPPPQQQQQQQQQQEQSVEDWGQQGWATPQPQPSLPAPDARALRLDQDAVRRFVGHYAPPPTAAPEPWQSRGERPWRAAQTATAPVVKVEPGTGDQEIPPPPRARAPASRAAPLATPVEPAPIEQPDVKPDIGRRSVSPPAPPPPRLKTGVAGWPATHKDLPVECNFPADLKRHPTAEEERRRTQARNRFKLKVRWELQNACKKVTRQWWVAGGLVNDWELDTHEGTWTQLFPDDVRTDAEREAFLDDQVAVVEAKGWSVLASGMEKRSDGQPIGVSISWVNDHPTPSPSPSPEPEPEPAPAPEPAPEPPAQHTRESTAASSVDANGFVRLTAPAPSSASPPRSSAQLPVPNPAATAFRVKLEPVDVDVDAIPPPSPPASLGPVLIERSPSPTTAASRAAAPPTVVVKPEPVDPDSPLSFGSDLFGVLSLSVGLMASLTAVDRAPDDLAAVERARTLYADFLAHCAGAQARADRRFDRMAARIQAGRPGQQSTSADQH